MSVNDSNEQSNNVDAAAQIMALYRKEPEKGFNLLYETYAGRLQGYVQRMYCLSSNQAEDLVHEAFLIWVESPEQMKMVERPAAYLFTSIRHLYQRVASKKGQIFANVELDTDMPEDLDNIKKTIDRLDAEQAMKILPVAQKEVLLLRLWEDLSLEEVAQIQQTSVPTVASRYLYALRKLKKVMNI